MRGYLIFILVHVLQDLKMTECLNFNMRVLGLTIDCPGLNCTQYISIRIKFGNSGNCKPILLGDYNCICCRIGTYRPKNCSIFTGTFSPERDSKIISHKTQDNESVATIRIAVHEHNDLVAVYRPRFKFCAELILSPDEKPQRRNLVPIGTTKNTHDTLTIEWNITSSETTTSGDITTQSIVTETSPDTSPTQTAAPGKGDGALPTKTIIGAICGTIGGVIVIISAIGVVHHCKKNKRQVSPETMDHNARTTDANNTKETRASEKMKQYGHLPPIKHTMKTIPQ